MTGKRRVQVRYSGRTNIFNNPNKPNNILAPLPQQLCLHTYTPPYTQKPTYLQKAGIVSAHPPLPQNSNPRPRLKNSPLSPRTQMHIPPPPRAHPAQTPVPAATTHTVVRNTSQPDHTHRRARHSHHFPCPASRAHKSMHGLEFSPSKPTTGPVGSSCAPALLRSCRGYLADGMPARGRGGGEGAFGLWYCFRAVLRAGRLLVGWEGFLFF
ncbi:uncharacterized protein K452DRAFT_27848 [Aplosporella prunicola CBS 121167]|uniref:Uncharacterized protein n=1 Tax=Aplosporella prunicola CBS 121167 TaxID=1176127 RepID=A0A6A6BDC3_9PEZI|nr:uncharacterized protein K452DRAFT_27848 [Aplosporella prunicola CBS 121167]KAF2142179.1 hypothetical protein K452DRAFT_27848 [Aplosporella prunicola CBS 121167]